VTNKTFLPFDIRFCLASRACLKFLLHIVMSAYLEIAMCNKGIAMSGVGFRLTLQ
jgi:hypothetical protein